MKPAVNKAGVEELDQALVLDPSAGSSRARWGGRRKSKRNYWARMAPAEMVQYPKFKEIGYLAESRLILRAQEGDLEARNAVWARNARLALSAVNRFAVPRNQLADAVQEGVLGLLRAIEKFDVQRYNQFSTYAWYWVSQSISRYLTRCRYRCPIPSNLYYPYRGYRRYKRLGMEFPDYDPDRPSQRSCFRRLDRIVDAESYGVTPPLQIDWTEPHQRVYAEESARSIRQALEHLDERGRMIITARYGLDGGEAKTLEEVADGLGVTRERVRQIQVVAERKLRGFLKIRAKKKSPVRERVTLPTSVNAERRCTVERVAIEPRGGLPNPCQVEAPCKDATTISAVTRLVAEHRPSPTPTSPPPAEAIAPQRTVTRHLDSLQMPRRYLPQALAELKLIYSQHRHDAKVVLAIRHELSFRKTKAAKEFLHKISSENPSSL
jgi:RNA polymerase sigma factor (sigma-70 family)